MPPLLFKVFLRFLHCHVCHVLLPLLIHFKTCHIFYYSRKTLIQITFPECLQITLLPSITFTWSSSLNIFGFPLSCHCYMRFVHVLGLKESHLELCSLPTQIIVKTLWTYSIKMSVVPTQSFKILVWEKEHSPAKSPLKSVPVQAGRCNVLPKQLLIWSWSGLTHRAHGE